MIGPDAFFVCVVGCGTFRPKASSQYMPPFRAAISKQTRFVQYFNGNDENSKLLFENCSKVVAGMLTHFYKNLRVSTDKMRKSPRKKHLI